MKLFKRTPDGGVKSGTTARLGVEFKSAFSVALLRFEPGASERFHTHAFNALTLWLKGRVKEHHLNGTVKEFSAGDFKVTKRSTFHRIEPVSTTWALTVRGPWVDRWQESRAGELVTLTHGRRELA